MVSHNWVNNWFGQHSPCAICLPVCVYGLAERIEDGVCGLVRDCGLKKRAGVSNCSVLFSIDKY